MKNIFLLPVSKSGSSKLLYNKEYKSFCFQKQPGSMYVNDGKVIGADFWGIEKASNNGFLPHYIYITSDEEIKEGDYFINKNGQISKCVKALEEWLKINKSDIRKIILTTDPTLIEDGVQAIDNEFLEWFIKNPTCEFVEVIKQLLCEYCGQEYCDRCKGYEDVDWYEIIIPQEEPKEVICRDKFDRVIQDSYYVDVQNAGVHKVYKKEDGQLYFKPYGKEERVSDYFSNDLILVTYNTKLVMDLKKEVANKEPKQGTLEEAAENYAKQYSFVEDSDAYSDFIAGAKSDAARDYWFEQFKKK